MNAPTKAWPGRYLIEVQTPDLQEEGLWVGAERAGLTLNEKHQFPEEAEKELETAMRNERMCPELALEGWPARIRVDEPARGPDGKSPYSPEFANERQRQDAPPRMCLKCNRTWPWESWHRTACPGCTLATCSECGKENPRAETFQDEKGALVCQRCAVLEGMELDEDGVPVVDGLEV